MDQESDRELVGRLQAGDAWAFDAIYERFNTRLFTFLARLSGNRSVAEDLLEETWLRLIQHSRRLQPDTRLGPWLFTVARNLHVSYCRSRTLEAGHAADLMGLWPTWPRRSPFEETAANEFERRVEAALSRLPLAYREVLLLVAKEGLRPADAATVCGISPEALRQRLSRARALLARRLEDVQPLKTKVLNEVRS
jgi:RNA polymerase sigma-70 factor (ECF subfamily)